MSIVLVTGSCGLVGSETVKFFISKGFEVVGIDNNSRLKFFGKDGDVNWVKKNLVKYYKNYIHQNIDIRNYSNLEKIFKKYKNSIKLIIHSAAQPSHDWAKTKPFIDFNINALGTLNLLNLTRKYSYDAPFIFMSTNKVYGDTPNLLPLNELNSRWEISKKHKYYKGINESMSIDNSIHSFFGASKCYADLIVQEYGKNDGLKTVCFRAGCITGPNHSGAELHGFLSYLVKSSLKNKKYSIFGYKGKQVRDNIHSYDLIKCFWNYFKRPKKGEVYNIGGGRKSNCSIIEALNFVELFTNVKVKKKYNKANRVGDHIWYISDTEKFQKHYPNWKQKYGTKEIIKELIYNYK
jgi:CDP-paratose 2-epimerase|tara:strand:- start:2882 stop:3931 length:1050 start_codon:yes stop_codon:yes gene_type:complete